MTPEETLAAAIEKLTRLRDTCFPGDWEVLTSGVEHGNHWYVQARSAAILSVSANDGSDEELREPTAQIVAVLHRTIDAQLAILRLGIEFAQISPNRYTDAAHALAAAILGVTS